MKLEHLVYFIRERHEIYLRRQRGDSEPWTEDKVLQKYFFTCPYRENDKTTRWFRQNVRDPLRDSGKVLAATFIFRRFNYIGTGQVLLKEGLLESWNSRDAKVLLRPRSKIFSPAYKISSPKGWKCGEVCSMIDKFWIRKDELLTKIEDSGSIGRCWELLHFPHHGSFMAYQVVCDLAHTYLLTDTEWAYISPRARRVLNELRMNVWEVRKVICESLEWDFSIHDAVHSLCAFFDYMTICDGGYVKRRFR